VNTILNQTKRVTQKVIKGALADGLASYSTTSLKLNYAGYEAYYFQKPSRKVGRFYVVRVSNKFEINKNA